MMPSFSEIIELIKTFRHIDRSAASPEIRVKLKNTFFWTVFLKRHDAVNKIAEIAGYKVKFCTYKALAYFFREIFLGQEYRFISDTPEPFIIDCGSNVGMSVLYFKLLYPDACILAFEPDDDAFSCLEANVRDNGLKSISLNRIALSKGGGKITFYHDKNEPGSRTMSIMQQRMPGESVTVEAAPLSGYIDKEVDFLKMDIEGAEQAVLEELCSSGKLRRVKQMAIEYHHHILTGEDNLSKMLSLLEDTGFGYQLSGSLARPFKSRQFQDILIYAYRKDSVAAGVSGKTA